MPACCSSTPAARRHRPLFPASAPTARTHAMPLVSLQTVLPALQELELHPPATGAERRWRLMARRAHSAGAWHRHYRCVLRLGAFSEPLKGLIHQMKYNRQWALPSTCPSACSCMRASPLLDRADVLVPPPAFPPAFRRASTRLRSSPAAFARFAQANGRALTRVRHTESQTQLTGKSGWTTSARRSG